MRVSRILEMNAVFMNMEEVSLWDSEMRWQCSSWPTGLCDFWIKGINIIHCCKHKLKMRLIQLFVKLVLVRGKNKTKQNQPNTKQLLTQSRNTISKNFYSLGYIAGRGIFLWSFWCWSMSEAGYLPQWSVAPNEFSSFFWT